MAQRIPIYGNHNEREFQMYDAEQVAFAKAGGVMVKQDSIWHRDKGRIISQLVWCLASVVVPTSWVLGQMYFYIWWMMVGWIAAAVWLTIICVDGPVGSGSMAGAYRVVSNGARFRPQRLVRYGFLWWTWEKWEDITYSCGWGDYCDTGTYEYTDEAKARKHMEMLAQAAQSLHDQEQHGWRSV